MDMAPRGGYRPAGRRAVAKITMWAARSRCGMYYGILPQAVTSPRDSYTPLALPCVNRFRIGRR